MENNITKMSDLMAVTGGGSEVLANLSLDTESSYFSYDNVSYDPVVNPYTYCEQAESLFEKYKLCAGRKQIETLTMNFSDQMQAIKISIHGRLYFVPQTHMQEVTLFEDFIEALNAHNQSGTPLVVNSMYVMDDEKQRKKMAAEFYNAVKKEIEEYQERAEHLIATDSQSPAVMAGLSKTHVSNIENAHSIPSVDAIVKIAEALGVTPDVFLLGLSRDLDADFF